MSLRLVSSAKNLRDQFKSTNNIHAVLTSGTSPASNGTGVDAAHGMPSSNSILPRQGSILRSSTSHSALRRAKSPSKKTTLKSKVFTDESGQQNALPDLSMDVTLVIVKRCVKEIRERGKFPLVFVFCLVVAVVQMGHSPKLVMDTIRLILDDDANTELSPLHQVNVHLVAHAMKWAIRYSAETLVTYEEYQTFFLNQDRSFSRFVRSLPPLNRQILLDLFSLCADVTLLAHLNNMTLVGVAKAISLSIMAQQEHEFTTFDASLQQRNLWGAACEDLLRAFLRIKTTHDLAKIEQEDDIDENRFVDNITRQVKSARQMNFEINAMQHSPMLPNSTGTMTPNGTLCRSGTGYFEQTYNPRPVSPFSQQTLSRSTSNAQSSSSQSRPISPSPYEQERLEYEEIMQDPQSHPHQLPHSHDLQFLAPGGRERRRSSVADMESLYMLPVDSTSDGGYESEPEPARTSLMPDFVDNLGWDLSNLDKLRDEDDLTSSKHASQGAGGRQPGLPSSDPSKRQLVSAPIFNIPLEDTIDEERVTPYGSIQRSSTLMNNNNSKNKARIGHAIAPGHTSPAMTPQRAKRNSILRRSISLDPHTMHGRVHKKPDEE
ncbi:hypothetical protein BGZ65_009319 [Modicella reniformis]|uniref:Rho-GAP domain-containing protein n=1 Tax=Modicella reniformis TaxID=1440133 RepID=A0A9P6ML52_9FUNG|nr:hypothetical protein BGZ65_009319 [Modicella reniformis]